MRVWDGDGVTEVKNLNFFRNSLQVRLKITMISFFSFFNSSTFGVNMLWLHLLIFPKGAVLSRFVDIVLFAIKFD